ncbi:MAG: hypothetical protein AAGA87_02310 [Pseudomonadota bacterium]
MLTVNGDLVAFKDDKDWLEVILLCIFLVIFPLAFGWMWLAPRDTVPLWAALGFTVGFALCVPFMVRRVRSARTRRVTIDQRTGQITVRSSTPFGHQTQMVDPREIEGLVFNTHDNDGEWHTASLRVAGEEISFAQGSVHEDVYGRFQRCWMSFCRFGLICRLTKPARKSGQRCAESAPYAEWQAFA